MHFGQWHLQKIPMMSQTSIVEVQQKTKRNLPFFTYNSNYFLIKYYFYNFLPF